MYDKSVERRIKAGMVPILYTNVRRASPYTPDDQTDETEKYIFYYDFKTQCRSFAIQIVSKRHHIKNKRRLNNILERGMKWDIHPFMLNECEFYDKKKIRAPHPVAALSYFRK